MMSKGSQQSNTLFRMLDEQNRVLPLAEALRPKSLDDLIGQKEILGSNTPLRQMIEAGEIHSLIFWGVPGIGKTTLARIIASSSQAQLIELSAVNSGLKELREAIQNASEQLTLHDIKTIVFIDEIHRYSKTQQDALLPYVENGTITLMGATTENPSFQVIPALLSRLLIVRLTPLSRQSIVTLIKRGVIYLGKTYQKVVIDLEAIGFIADYANGDGRSALNLLETAFKCARMVSSQENETVKQKHIELALLEQLAQQNRLNYDRQGDEHYDHASAYQKSMRGGDANAAVYWLAKMLAGGEDPRFIARRLMITASEDVGLADPQAFQLAVAAAQAVEKLGMPEGRIPLAMATVYTANAKKSNAAICAIDAAMADITKHGHAYPVPIHLRDSHYSGAQDYGHGNDYVYTHDNPDVAQDFLPAPLAGKRYV